MGMNEPAPDMFPAVRDTVTNLNGETAADTWMANYVAVADGLPARITPGTLAGIGASTHGTRCLQSALRYFDKTLANNGWVLDEAATYAETWSGNGEFVISRDGETRHFVLDGEYKVRLSDQWADLLREGDEGPSRVKTPPALLAFIGILGQHNGVRTKLDRPASPRKPWQINIRRGPASLVVSYHGSRLFGFHDAGGWSDGAVIGVPEAAHLVIARLEGQSRQTAR